MKYLKMIRQKIKSQKQLNIINKGKSMRTFLRVKNPIPKVFVIFFFGTLGIPAQSYYYDGERKVEIHEIPDLMAETIQSVEEVQTTENSIVKKIEPQTNPIQQLPGIRFWKTNPNLFIQKANQYEKSKKIRIPELETKYLPVYTNQSNTKLVPTGNIIVYFPLSMTEMEVKAWSAKKGIRAKEKLPLKTKNVWLLETPSGKKSIEIANKIHESGEVESATPNFWIEFDKK